MQLHPHPTPTIRHWMDCDFKWFAVKSHTNCKLQWQQHAACTCIVCVVWRWQGCHSMLTWGKKNNQPVWQWHWLMLQQVICGTCCSNVTAIEWCCLWHSIALQKKTCATMASAMCSQPQRAAYCKLCDFVNQVFAWKILVPDEIFPINLTI